MTDSPVTDAAAAAAVVVHFELFDLKNGEILRLKITLDLKTDRHDLLQRCVVEFNKSNRVRTTDAFSSELPAY